MEVLEETTEQLTEGQMQLVDTVTVLQQKLAELEQRTENLETTNQQLVETSAALLAMIQENANNLEPDVLAERLPPINFQIMEDGRLVGEVPRKLGQTLQLDWNKGETQMGISQ